MGTSLSTGLSGSMGIQARMQTSRGTGTGTSNSTGTGSWARTGDDGGSSHGRGGEEESGQDGELHFLERLVSFYLF